MVARKDSEAARIDRQGLRHSKLCAEIGHKSVVALTRVCLVEPRWARKVILKVLGAGGKPRQESLILTELFESIIRELINELHWVVPYSVPKLPVHLPE